VNSTCLSGTTYTCQPRRRPTITPVDFNLPSTRIVSGTDTLSPVTFQRFPFPTHRLVLAFLSFRQLRDSNEATRTRGTTLFESPCGLLSRVIFLLHSYILRRPFSSCWPMAALKFSTGPGAQIPSPISPPRLHRFVLPCIFQYVLGHMAALMSPTGVNIRLFPD